LLTSRRVIRIEWGDCDPAGIVFYPRYFAWFDACTAGLLELAGTPKHKLFAEEGVGIPMVETRAKFLLPARFGDEVTVETAITRFGRSSFDVHHRLLKNGELGVESFETRVWTAVELTGGRELKSRAIPEALKRRLSGE